VGCPATNPGILKIEQHMFKVLKRKYYDQLDEHMLEVLQGSAVTFAIKVVGAALTFVFNVVLARLLGAEGAGIYFLALTLTTIAATIGRFGLENTLLRFVSAHAVKQEWNAVKGVFNKSMIFALRVSSGLTILLYLLAPWLAEQAFHKPDLTTPLRLMSLAIVPFTIYWLVAEALKGLKQIRNSQLLQGTAMPALSCLGLLAVGSRFGINGAVTVFVVACFLVLGWGGWLWRKADPHLPSALPVFPNRQIYDSCIPLLWVQLVYLALNWASLVFLGIWGTRAEVGVFGAALRTAMLTSFILVSVNSIAAPKFSALYAQGDLAGVASVARQTTWMMTICAAPILLLFVLAPQSVMAIFGENFSAGGSLLAIMAIGQFVNVVTGSVAYLLIMSGHEKLMRNNTLVVGVLTVVLNLVLIPRFGSTGAALATAISISLQNLGMYYLVRKKLRINTLPSFQWSR
jgi:O-antigen/teichoic acid export membrane protein